MVLIFDNKTVKEIDVDDFNEFKRNNPTKFIIPYSYNNLKTFIKQIFFCLEIFLYNAYAEKDSEDISKNQYVLNSIFSLYSICNEIYSQECQDRNIGNKNEYISKRMLENAPAFIINLYNLSVEIYENGHEIEKDVDPEDIFSLINPKQETIDELNFLKDVTKNEECKEILQEKIDDLILKYKPKEFDFLEEIRDIFVLLELKNSKTRMQY
jgi:hypothetical protein